MPIEVGVSMRLFDFRKVSSLVRQQPEYHLFPKGPAGRVESGEVRVLRQDINAMIWRWEHGHPGTCVALQGKET